MIPGEVLSAATGEIELNAGRETRDAHGRQHRRPPDPGRLPLPLLRGEPALAFDRARGARHAARRPGRHGGALRAGPVAHRRRSCRSAARGGCSASRQAVMGPLDVKRRDGDRISRAAYADLYGPTTGDRVRLADTELVIEVEARPHDLRRRGEVRRRQGDPRRHGPEPGDARRGARPRHHERADPRPLGHREGRHRHPRRPHRRRSARPATRTCRAAASGPSTS